MKTIQKNRNRWNNTLNWIHNHKHAAFAIAAIGIVLASGIITFAIMYRKPEPIAVTTAAIVEPPKIEPVKYYSNLTGIQVNNEAATKQAVTAVMIENSPDARPQSGLKQAGVVYEAIAEGGITRFMALYQNDKPSLVGPVRSVRQYFVEWVRPYNASVAHVGGSSRALSMIRGNGYRDIDQFFNPATYWRANDRYAPHNVYTNFKNLDTLNKQKGFKTSNFKGLDRTTGKAVTSPTASKIAINFSSSLYNTNYVFDKKTNSYNRSLAGEAHTDREKGRIKPSVIIAMKVDEQTVMEDGNRERIPTTGSGKAYVFQNGTSTEGTWRRGSVTDQLQFIDKSGKVIKITSGQTWIAAVPNNGGSVSWQ